MGMGGARAGLWEGEVVFLALERWACARKHADVSTQLEHDVVQPAADSLEHGLDASAYERTLHVRCRLCARARARMRVLQDGLDG